MMMTTKSRPRMLRRYALTLLATLAVITCGEDSTGPTPSEWDLVIAAADGSVRAVVVEISGGPVQPSPIAGYSLYTRSRPDATVIIVVPEGGATFLAGSTTVATVARDEAGGLESPAARVQQAAGTDYQLLRPHQIAARLEAGSPPR